jgi:hypothetical protein
MSSKRPLITQDSPPESFTRFSYSLSRPLPCPSSAMICYPHDWYLARWTNHKVPNYAVFFALLPGILPHFSAQLSSAAPRYRTPQSTLWLPLYVRDQVLHPHKTGEKIIFLVQLYTVLTFRNRSSDMSDRHTATLQPPHFIYFFNKYTYWIF